MHDATFGPRFWNGFYVCTTGFWCCRQSSPEKERIPEVLWAWGIQCNATTFYGHETHNATRLIVPNSMHFRVRVWQSFSSFDHTVMCSSSLSNKKNLLYVCSESSMCPKCVTYSVCLYLNSAGELQTSRSFKMYKALDVSNINRYIYSYCTALRL